MAKPELHSRPKLYNKLKRWPVGKLRDAKPASQPLLTLNTLAARAAQKYSAYYSTPNRGAWPSLNYT